MAATVYHFMRAVAFGVNLNLDTDNWNWVHCLTLPLNVLQFSLRPYKWIRYAIGVVVGVEGDLSSSSGSLNIVDYNGWPLNRVCRTILSYQRRRTTRGKECSRSILTSHAQRSLPVLPLFEGLISALRLQHEMVMYVS